MNVQHSNPKSQKEIRGLAWVAAKWAEKVRPRIVMLENVEEFQTWGPLLADNRPCPDRKGDTFRRWLSRFRALGYRERIGELKAHQYGAPTIRKRLFIVLRCDGVEIPWPEETHGPGLLPYRTAAECIDWTLPCPSIFLSREEGRAIGVNRPLADATMRRIARGVKRYVLDAAEPFIVNMSHGGKVEDIEDPVSTIATEKGGCRALVTPFIAGVGGRMGQSAERSTDDPYQTITAKADSVLVAPLLASLTHHGENRTEDVAEPFRTITGAHRGEKALVAAVIERQFGNSAGNAADEPLGTTTAGGGGKSALVAAHLSRYYGTKRPGNERAGSLDEPIPTQPTENRHAVVAAFLAQHNTGMVGRAAEDPLSTIMGRGTNQALVASYLSKMRGTNIGSASDAPLHTISANGTHHAEVRAFLMKYYGTDQDPRLEGPLHTIPTKDRFGLVMVEGEEYAIVDIGMRMLAPRELFRAQGFPDSYIISYGIDEYGQKVPLTKTAQVRLCGNSVSPPPAVALIRAQFSMRSSEAAA